MDVERWRLRLSERRLEAGEVLGPLSGEAWAITRDGIEAAIGTASEVYKAGGEGRAFLFEIARARPLAASEQAGLLTSIVTPPAEASVLLRVDHIKLEPGSITPRHRHSGPGIRLLLEGSIDAMVNDRRFIVRPGEAWLETSDDDIIGRASGDVGASFVRFVLLPPELEGGKSSFIAVPRQPGDPEGPFERQQTILAERLLNL